MNYCSRCGTKIAENQKFCSNCGFNLENISFHQNIQNPDLANENLQIRNQESQVIKNVYTKNKGNLMLVISIINICVVVPFVFNFGCLWLVLGGLCESEFKYYTILIGCIIYCIMSIVFLISAIKRRR